jgi:hypothetical protein
MCLEVTARLVPDVQGTVGAPGLSKASGLHVVKMGDSKALEFRLVPGGCGCTLLAKGAKSDSPFVPLDSAVLPGLEKALKLLGDKAGRFSFSAVWLLDPAELLPAVRLPLKDLIRKVRDNQIENGREYVVGKPA